MGQASDMLPQGDDADADPEERHSEPAKPGRKKAGKKKHKKGVRGMRVVSSNIEEAEDDEQEVISL